jgi:hypothetical protein
MDLDYGNSGTVQPSSSRWACGKKGLWSVQAIHAMCERSRTSRSPASRMSAAAITRAFGLGFVPLQQVRYDIVILKEYLHDALVEQLLNTLSSHRFRAQLNTLGGYDTGHTADVVATLEPGSAPLNRAGREDRHG